MKNAASLNLIHFANFNSTNIGNGALISGLESTLEEDFASQSSAVQIQWRREAWDDYTFGLVDFDQAFVDKINASDGLIVGGAVTFNGRDYNTRTGTRFELPWHLWDSIKKPVVFYGLSYRHWAGQTYHHLDKLRGTLERILASRHMILSVRNDGTKKWIKDMVGIESPKIIEVPDSAVFVCPQDSYFPELRDGFKNIMIAFNDEDAAHRFDPKKNQASREDVVNSLVAALERLADQFPVNFILCPHYFDDYRMMSAFIERIRPRLAHQQMVSTGLCRVKDTGIFYGRYQKADLAISMRVHSMSPCIGLGTPLVAYTTQDRMTNFLDQIGLSDLSVNAFGVSVVNSLYERAKFTLENSDAVKEQLLSVRRILRESARAFHRQIFELIAF